MNIDIIASSSSGNAVVVSDGTSQLLLDAGLSYKKLSRKVNMQKIECVLITHSHQDHCKAVIDLLIRGHKVCMSQGTCDALKPFAFTQPTILKHLKQYETKNWIVLPFDVIHDVQEPLGFLFQSKNTGKKGVYIVDSSYISYDFKGVTHWLMEANYDQEGIDNSKLDSWLVNRIKKNHFSLENLIKFFKATDLSTAEEVHLLHLSNSHADKDRFVKRLERQIGVPVYV